MSNYTHDELTNSWRINPHKRTKTKKIVGVLEELFRVLKPSLGVRAMRYKDQYLFHFNVIVTNLVFAYKFNPRLWVAFPLGSDNYSDGTALREAGLTHNFMTKSVQALLSHGLIELAKGFRGEGVGFTSRMKGTGFLFEFVKQSTFNPKNVVSILNRVVLKGSNSRAIIQKSKVLTRIRRNLKTINRLLTRSDITVDLNSKEIDYLREKWRLTVVSRGGSGSTNKTEFNLSNRTLYRVFNDNCLNEIGKTELKGGRFYGHFVQSLPSSLRKKVLIDGEPVVEYDFRSLLPNMLLNLSGQKCVEDAYDIKNNKVYIQGRALNGWHLREHYKSILLIVVNSSDKLQAIRAIMTKFNHKKGGSVSRYHEFPARLKGGMNEQDRGMTDRHGAIKKIIKFTRSDVIDLIDHFFRVFPVYSQFAYSGKGIELQYVDSQIAEHVLLSLAEKNIVCIPIHDSFIVQKKYGRVLELAMMKAYSYYMNFRPYIQRKY